MEQGAEGIRWGRALLAAIIVEILLTVVAAPVALLSAAPASTLNLLVPPASFLVAALVVAWLFRGSERPIANGVTTGLISLAIYIALAVAAHQIAPDQVDFSQTFALPNLASQLLKIAGAVAGGWWIARNRPVADSDPS